MHWTILNLERSILMSRIKELRLQAELTQKQMSDLFKIPIRTLQDWEGERRTPPEWASLLICEKLESMINNK